MIEVYDECKKAVANNKCSECNEYYSCYLCDYVEKRYQQGKADVWKDIEKIISNMSNPIQTMEIIIKQMKEQK